MGMIRIQKNPKRKVRMPETGEELAEDEVYEVEDSVHWRRRIQSSDVKEVAVALKQEKKNEAEEEEKRKAEAEAEAEAKRKAAEETAKKAAKSSGKKK